MFFFSFYRRELSELRDELDEEKLKRVALQVTLTMLTHDKLLLSAQLLIDVVEGMSDVYQVRFLALEPWVCNYEELILRLNKLQFLCYFVGCISIEFCSILEIPLDFSSSSNYTSFYQLKLKQSPKFNCVDEKERQPFGNVN